MATLRVGYSNKWLCAYINSCGVSSSYCVQESINYAVLEPILNDITHSKSYSDKNLYNLFYPDFSFPEVIARNINGIFYKDDYSPIKSIDEIIHSENMLSDLIVKPSIDSGGGKGVELFPWSKDGFFNKKRQALSLAYLQNHYGENYIIQKRIKQHNFFSYFNTNSFNTVRVLTYKSVVSGEVFILHSILRVGLKGNMVDNLNSGGFAIGINKNGILNQFATDKRGKKHFVENKIDLNNVFQIPFFETINEVAKSIAKKNLRHNLLGLDLCITETGEVKCVEVNNHNNEINFYQFNNGPLFGEFTNEIIDYSSKNKHKLYERIIIKR